MAFPIFILGGGAAAVALSQHHADPSGTPGPSSAPPPTPQPVRQGGSMPIGSLVTKRPTMSASMAGLRPPRLSPLDNTNSGTGGGISPIMGDNGNWFSQANVTAKQKYDDLKAKVAAEYDKLTTQAKQAAVNELNSVIKPSPGLKPDDSFQDVTRKVGSALGGKGGKAACDAIPVVGGLIDGQCETLGAIAGAYLGDKLGSWAKDAYTDVKSWVNKEYDQIEGKVKGAISDAEGTVEDAAKSAVDSVTGFIGGLF